MLRHCQQSLAFVVPAVGEALECLLQVRVQTSSDRWILWVYSTEVGS